MTNEEIAELVHAGEVSPEEGVALKLAYMRDAGYSALKREAAMIAGFRVLYGLPEDAASEDAGGGRLLRNLRHIPSRGGVLTADQARAFEVGIVGGLMLAPVVLDREAVKDEPIHDFERAASDPGPPPWVTRVSLDPEPATPSIRARVAARLSRVPMWFWEQTVLLALLFVATYMTVSRLPPFELFTPGAAPLAYSVLSGILVMIGQKQRSIADRQREANRLAGVSDVAVECRRAQEFYGTYAQVFGLVVGAVAATNWAHLLVLAYVGLYPTWRKLYRRWRPVLYAVSGGAPGSDLGPAIKSFIAEQQAKRGLREDAPKD
jgi:hypothetical protein